MSEAEKLARLLREIEREVRETARYTGRKELKPEVSEALAQVLRHRFVPEALKEAAYQNRPLPIGYGQTISQPFIVAIMTELLDLEPDHRVLEVGTGCGYQTAILAELAKEVYSIERVPELAEQAEKRLTELGYRNVEITIGNGFKGWPEKAAFDRIIVTAAPEEIPKPLLEQLKPGGKMVIPVGPPFDQRLKRVVKREDGTIEVEDIFPVAFVPMVNG